MSGSPLTVPFYESRALEQWVAEIVERFSLAKALVFSSSMAQFLDTPKYTGMRRVIDFVDVDSQKWAAYAEQKVWPINKIYAREARTLLNYERSIAKAFDLSLFVSSAEARLFERVSGINADKIGVLNNGVDFARFDPDLALDNPYPSTTPRLVFTGAMDYWANVDAVCWFADQVFKEIRAAEPRVEFWIVGSNPTREVTNLDKLPGVTVTGFVDDIRPYLKYADAAVAPLRVARGIQNKVLEAMAMAKPVVCTPAAMEGIEIGACYEPLISEKTAEIVNICRNALGTNQYDTLGNAGREYVQKFHEWTSQLQTVGSYLEGNNQSP